MEPCEKGGRAMKWKTVVLGLILLPAGLRAQPPYDPEQDTLIAGKIVTIVHDSARPEEIRVEVVTPHGDTILVHLAPGWYLDQRIHLRAGDTLLIEGSLRPGEMVARRIRTPGGEVSVELRDREGFPLWMGEVGRNGYRPDREDTLRGRVVDMREVLPPRGSIPIWRWTSSLLTGTRFRWCLDLRGWCANGSGWEITSR